MNSNSKNEEENPVKYPIDMEQDSGRHIIWSMLLSELWKYIDTESPLNTNTMKQQDKSDFILFV